MAQRWRSFLAPTSVKKWKLFRRKIWASVDKRRPLLLDSPLLESNNITSEISKSFRGRGIFLLLDKVFNNPGKSVVLATWKRIGNRVENESKRFNQLFKSKNNQPGIQEFLDWWYEQQAHLLCFFLVFQQRHLLNTKRKKKKFSFCSVKKRKKKL